MGTRVHFGSQEVDDFEAISIPGGNKSIFEWWYLLLSLGAIEVDDLEAVSIPQGVDA